ncbi:MAG: DinB family protein [Anaerolineae bacterium]|nr:DinB family protein [Anaerolineae bacterium]
MDADRIIRQQLVNLLSVRQAHMGFEDAVKDFPPEHINSRLPNAPYTFWHLLEHIRFCQRDIIDYILDPDYAAPEFPAGLWLDREATTDTAGWQRTIDAFLADREELVELVQDPATDLYAPILHGWDGHNILRELLIVADHNAYHVGELGGVRQIMGLW